jgi:hypothetical protein
MDKVPSPTVKAAKGKEGRGRVPISKFFPAALIALLVLGFAVNEPRKPKDSATDRIRQRCEMENITEAQVKECRFRLSLQKRTDERSGQLQIRR